MDKITDERLDELIAMYEWFVCKTDVRTQQYKAFLDILLALKELKHLLNEKVTVT